MCCLIGIGLVCRDSRLSNIASLAWLALHGMLAMARGMAELIAHGEFRTLDLCPFGFQRIERGEPFLEKIII